jgi:hypothetical protein
MAVMRHFDVEGTTNQYAVPGARGAPNRAHSLVGRGLDYTTEGHGFESKGVRLCRIRPRLGPSRLERPGWEGQKVTTSPRGKG